MILIPYLAICRDAADLTTGRQTVEKLKDIIVKLTPLHSKLKLPQTDDWLKTHSEPGQTFEQYLRSPYTRPWQKRQVIYIQPIGILSVPEQDILTLTSEYMAYFFNLEIKTRPILPLDFIPSLGCRYRPDLEQTQLLTTYILEKLLKPRLPTDAMAMIAFTHSDLWPGGGWNFVFGQASLHDRIAVLSLNRFGNPAENKTMTLRRTLKLSVHETAHMFSLLHCTTYTNCDRPRLNHDDSTIKDISVPCFNGSPHTPCKKSLTH